MTGLTLQERADRYAGGLVGVSARERAMAVRAYRAGWLARDRAEKHTAGDDE